MNIVHVGCKSAEFIKAYQGYRQKFKSLMARKDGLDPGEDHVYVESYFSQIMTGYAATDLVLCLDDNEEVIGYVVGSLGNIFDIYVPLPFRRRKIGTEMVTKYIEVTKTTAEKYQASWIIDSVETLNFFLSLGFTTTHAHDRFSPSMDRFTATRDGDPLFHEIRLDEANGYEDLRDDYVVVDGKYTLKQLESLLVIARGHFANAK